LTYANTVPTCTTLGQALAIDIDMNIAKLYIQHDAYMTTCHC
jgi:hypothetical protein